MTQRPAPGRRVPLPREHGAWVMLYAPLLTALFVYPVGWVVSLQLITLATAAFFAQNALGLILRHRDDGRTRRWLVICSLVVIGGVSLLVTMGHARVLWLAVPAAILLGWQALRRRLTRRQIDHSLTNELITVPVLGLGAPAVYIIAGETLDRGALLPWFVFSLYFTGSVFFVKMLVGALRDPSPEPLRWHRGGACLAFHGVILLLLLVGCLRVEGGRVLFPGLIAFAPVVGRTVLSWWRLSKKPPPLRRVGFIETGIAVWFSFWAGLGLHQWESLL